MFQAKVVLLLISPLADDYVNVTFCYFCDLMPSRILLIQLSLLENLDAHIVVDSHFHLVSTDHIQLYMRETPQLKQIGLCHNSYQIIS